MDDRTRNLHDALERAVERFQVERAAEESERASDPDGERPPHSDASEPVVVREVDRHVLEDLASKYNTVLCPIHGGPPRFDVEGKAVREWFCCETLLSLVRELSKKDAAA